MTDQHGLPWPRSSTGHRMSARGRRRSRRLRGPVSRPVSAGRSTAGVTGRVDGRFSPSPSSTSARTSSSQTSRVSARRRGAGRCSRIYILAYLSAAHAPMEQQPPEVTFRRKLGRDRGENFSLPYGVADCAAPPVSKRRLRSGPNLHPGDTHHCADGLFARDKRLVHDSANARSLVLFLARPRAGAAGVETCMEQTITPRLITYEGHPARSSQRFTSPGAGDGGPTLAERVARHHGRRLDRVSGQCASSNMSFVRNQDSA